METPEPGEGAESADFPQLPGSRAGFRLPAFQSINFSHCNTLPRRTEPTETKANQTKLLET